VLSRPLIPDAIPYEAVYLKPNTPTLVRHGRMRRG